MPFEEMGAVLLFLAVVFISGNLWFHFMKTILRWVKKIFPLHRDPPVWHTLPPDEEDRKDV